jgi:molybdopterin synthase sulfur carrier subunit
MTRVLLFGRLRDVAGWRERLVEPSPTTLFALRALLGADDPALCDALAAPGVQAAVDKALMRGDAPLAVNSEVAFLSPMSGG